MAYIVGKKNDLPETVDDIASALLDDSTLDQNANLGEKRMSTTSALGHPSQTKLAAMPSVDPDEAHQAHLLASATDSRETSDHPSHGSKNTGPAKKASPTMPRRPSSHRRKRSVRTRRVSPRGSSGIGPAKSGRKSRTGALDPLGMNPPRLAPSPSVLLSDQGDPGTPISSPAHHVCPTDTTQKIELMLAATQALKPDCRSMPSLPPSNTNPRLPRLTKQRSVFKKMTNALADRFNNKSHIFAKGRGNMAGGLSGEIFVDEQPVILSDRDPSMTSIGTQFDKGEDLDKHKAQSMDGRSAPRKPILKSRKSLKSPVTLEDPFKEFARVKRAPTEFESRLREKSVSEADESLVAPLPAGNPFEIEKVLDSSIDSILPSAPLASSTPRIRLEGLYAISGSPTKSAGDPATLDVIGSSLATDPSGPQCPALNRDGLDTQVLRETSRNIARGRRRPENLGLDYIAVVGAEDRKKHPSPNKSDLELLEMRFREHFPDIVLDTHRENDETDELARSPTSPLSANPQVVEKKVRIRNDVPSPDVADTESAKAPCPLSRCYQGSSLLPRPGPLTRSWTRQARLALYRRLPTESMETDELQWDLKASGPGMNEVC